MLYVLFALLYVYCDGGDDLPMSTLTVMIHFDALPAGESNGLNLQVNEDNL